MKYLNNLIILFILYLAGCTVSPVYRLNPVPGGGEYRNGRLLVSVEDSAAKSVLTFNAQAGAYFSFFVVIENKSDSSFNIFPEDFYAEVIHDNGGLELPDSLRLYALNPEMQLETIDKNIAALNSEKSFNDGLNCLFIGAYVAVDVATIGHEKTEEEKNAGQDISEAIQNKINNDEINYQDKKYNLEKDKDHWQYEVLRATTLMPGEKIGGLFYIPISNKAKVFRVIIPVGNMEHIYTYEQVKIN